MAIQIVMDHTGDSRHPFNPNDALALAKAEMRFRELIPILKMIDRCRPNREARLT